MKKIWAIVLAAGKSTRMEKQKLLLPIQGETMIEKVVKTASEVVGRNIIVVLGSHRKEIRQQVNTPHLTYSFNKAYAEGMLSSVICGFDSLPEDADAAILFLGDQPLIPASVPKQLVTSWLNSGKGIILPTYSGKRGHPVLVASRYKNEIKQLDPRKGLRSLMEKFANDVHEINCAAPEITRDIDTPSDYYDVINKNN